MSRGSRGNRMQQLAALWLADCTSGLMQPLTRELIFHRGYVLPRFSLPSFHLLSLSLSFSLQLSFHGSFFIDCSTRPFVLVRVIYFPLHLWPWIRATPFTTLVESIAIYSSLPGRWDCLRSPFCSCDRSTMSLPPPPSPPFRPDLNAAWHCQMQYDEASQDFMLIAPSMTIRSLVQDLYDSFIES